ncbi:CBS domain-containing protein [Limimonas halophila]|uniref:CBS domain-containing protein n=1 Tax=Limimonas halophila TaxID=1082479 RepID=A0A1G7SJY8_9PROT|nr:hemolysin family protein [Limimonas halophila]SDG23365.1 CBS domain-containing protein [Limimonas halophila]
MNEDSPRIANTAVRANGGAASQGGARLTRGGPSLRQALGSWLRGLVKSHNGEAGLRETLEEIIEESEREDDTAQPISSHERLMLANILHLRHLTAYDIMVPRADIRAIHTDAGFDDLVDLMSRGGHSRLPVYRESLDDVIGLVHIKDVLAHARSRHGFQLSRVTREVLFVAPSMPLMDLMLEMRLSRSHLALVVDEFGGVDGLVTIEDVVEEIVGEIEDEHDTDESPQLVERPDGSLVADARLPIEDFEERVRPFLSPEEREEDIDTLGGLIVFIADRVPARGELVIHEGGFTFEVMEADPRRVKRLRIRDNLPPQPRAETAEEPDD